MTKASILSLALLVVILLSLTVYWIVEFPVQKMRSALGGHVVELRLSDKAYRFPQPIRLDEKGLALKREYSHMHSTDQLSVKFDDGRKVDAFYFINDGNIIFVPVDRLDGGCVAYFPLAALPQNASLEKK